MVQFPVLSGSLKAVLGVFRLPFQAA
jgi:hypothetical protein